MTERRSTGRHHVARAIWYVASGKVELRHEHLKPPAPNEARIRTEFSGISRGTERLICSGGVPETEHERMRAPLQAGAFPFPIKYGYCATGVVEVGPNELIGRRVFCLHPHQDSFLAPVDMLVTLPDLVTSRRATLAANMETALNAHWDAGTGPADRIAVVGAGIVGLLVAFIAARIASAQVYVIDLNLERRALVESLSAHFLDADTEGCNADVVFHTSASAAGLATAIRHAGMEARVVELSWYGARDVSIGLGGQFHSQRLELISSQVGQVAARRRPRWDYRRRLEAALGLLSDPVLDKLVDKAIDFEDAPRLLPGILEDAGLAPVIRYPAAQD